MNQLRRLPRRGIVPEPLPQQIRIADDGREQIVEIVRHAAGQPSHRFHLLRVPQHLLALVQRLLRSAALIHLPHQIRPLGKERLDEPRQFPKLRLLPAQRLERFHVLGVQAADDPLQGPHDRTVEQQKEHDEEREGTQQ
ncbi:MAG: hypothetical protein WDN28_07820 [Chthoniobacter sp.]